MLLYFVAGVDDPISVDQLLKLWIGKCQYGLASSMSGAVRYQGEPPPSGYRN